MDQFQWAYGLNSVYLSCMLDGLFDVDQFDWPAWRGFITIILLSKLQLQ